jgi:hypothetical protein
MKSRDALRVLAEVTESQWGLVTSAQAVARGVTHMNLTRLTESGDLVRLAHGVYRDAGAPVNEHEGMRAAWLSLEPKTLAAQRIANPSAGVAFAGESAAVLHGLGDFRAARHDLVAPTRRQSQRPDMLLRVRRLGPTDVTLVDGLPVMRIERTIADLVESDMDRSLVAHALADAVRQGGIDLDRLAVQLSPLAARNGHSKGDGIALVEELMREAGLDAQAVARRIAALPKIGPLVVSSGLGNLMPDVSTSLTAIYEALLADQSGPVAQLMVSLQRTMSQVLAPLTQDVRAFSESQVAEIGATLSEQVRAIGLLAEASAAPTLAAMPAADVAATT